MSSQKPLVGISSCLLGNNVRYDGGNKHNHTITDQLSQSLRFFTICPELEMGLGVPREPVNLHRESSDAPIEMITVTSRLNLTVLAHETSAKIIAALPSELCGFIFKNDSPSCGLEQVNLYSKATSPEKIARGIFAEAFCAANPLIPAIEEEQLSDLTLRRHFLERVFALWHQRKDH